MPSSQFSHSQYLEYDLSSSVYLVSCIIIKKTNAADQEPILIASELLAGVILLVGTPSGVVANDVVTTDSGVRVNAAKLCSDFVGSDPSSSSGSSPDSELDLVFGADLVFEALGSDVA